MNGIGNKTERINDKRNEGWPDLSQSLFFFPFLSFRSRKREREGEKSPSLTINLWPLNQCVPSVLFLDPRFFLGIHFFVLSCCFHSWLWSPLLSFFFSRIPFWFRLYFEICLWCSLFCTSVCPVCVSWRVNTFFFRIDQCWVWDLKKNKILTFHRMKLLFNFYPKVPKKKVTPTKWLT